MNAREVGARRGQQLALQLAHIEGLSRREFAESRDALIERIASAYARADQRKAEPPPLPPVKRGRPRVARHAASAAERARLARDRHERRLARNRRAATISRLTRRARTYATELHLAFLQRDNAALLATNTALRAASVALRTEVAAQRKRAATARAEAAALRGVLLVCGDRNGDGGAISPAFGPAQLRSSDTDSSDGAQSLA